MGSNSSTGSVSTLYTLSGVTMFNNQLRATGGFYQTSDERLKIFNKDVEIDFETLKLIPKKYFTWKDGGHKNAIGTIAQELQKYYPELVSKNENGYLSVNYSLLSIIALKAIDKLYEYNLLLDKKLKTLEERL